MPLRLAAVVAALVLVPVALAQTDPPPSTAEVSPGVVLTIDWGPVARLEVVLDEEGYPETVDGCTEWAGEFYPNIENAGEDHGNGQIVLREATAVIDGRRVALDTRCVGGYVWSPLSTEADAFEVTRPLPGVVELQLGLDWDASGASTVTWTVGPGGARRTEAFLDSRGGLGRALRSALDADRAARGALAQALAAAVATERAAAAARGIVDLRRAALRRTVARARAVFEGQGATLDSIGVALPDPPPVAGTPLRLSACAVVPDSAAARVEPGAGAVLVARIGTAEAAVAWVDFGDGASDLVVVEDGGLRVPHTYGYPGTYRATVAAVDPGGAETCAVEVTVGDGEASFCSEATELNTVYFDAFGQTAVGPEIEARIVENAELLRACPSLCVSAVGYSDMTDDGAVSETRAEIVRARYLEEGIALDRVRAEGAGEGEDCAAYEDPGPGDRRCRRVESVPVACAETR